MSNAYDPHVGGFPGVVQSKPRGRLISVGDSSAVSTLRGALHATL